MLHVCADAQASGTPPCFCRPLSASRRRRRGAEVAVLPYVRRSERRNEAPRRGRHSADINARRALQEEHLLVGVEGHLPDHAGIEHKVSDFLLSVGHAQLEDLGKVVEDHLCQRARLLDRWCLVRFNQGMDYMHSQLNKSEIQISTT